LYPIKHIISVINEDDWGRGVHNKRWSSFGVNDDLLVRLLFFIRVIEDDDVTVTRQPKKLTVKFTEEPSDELFILCNVREAFLLLRRKDPPLGSPRRARRAHSLVRVACVRTHLTGTPVATVIQTEMAVAWKHRWMKTKNHSRRGVSA
jgi:hypothetical protein